MHHILYYIPPRHHEAGLLIRALVRDSHILNGSHVLNASSQSIHRVWPLTLTPAFFQTFLSLQVPEHQDFPLDELEAENYSDSLLTQHYHNFIFGKNLIISYFKNNPYGSFCQIRSTCISDRWDFIFNDLCSVKAPRQKATVYCHLWYAVVLYQKSFLSLFSFFLPFFPIQR